MASVTILGYSEIQTPYSKYKNFCYMIKKSLNYNTVHNLCMSDENIY